MGIRYLLFTVGDEYSGLSFEREVSGFEEAEQAYRERDEDADDEFALFVLEDGAPPQQFDLSTVKTKLPELRGKRVTVQWTKHGESNSIRTVEERQELDYEVPTPKGYWIGYSRDGASLELAPTPPLGGWRATGMW